MGPIRGKTLAAAFMWWLSSPVLLDGDRRCGSSSVVQAFIPSSVTAERSLSSSSSYAQGSSFTIQKLSTEMNNDEDCGCGPSTEAITLYSGKPSDRARNSVNPREAIRQSAFRNLKGEVVRMDDLIGSPDRVPPAVSVVVFLRSLG